MLHRNPVALYTFYLEAGAIPREMNNIICENYVLLSRSCQHL